MSALRAAEAEDDTARNASGLPAVESFLRETLDSGELLRLKLGNPLGVAAHLLNGALEKVDGRLELLGDDLRTIDDIEGQTGAWMDDVQRELRPWFRTPAFLMTAAAGASILFLTFLI